MPVYQYSAVHIKILINKQEGETAIDNQCSTCNVILVDIHPSCYNKLADFK